MDVFFLLGGLAKKKVRFLPEVNGCSWKTYDRFPFGAGKAYFQGRTAVSFRDVLVPEVVRWWWATDFHPENWGR